MCKTIFLLYICSTLPLGLIHKIILIKYLQDQKSIIRSRLQYINFLFSFLPTGRFTEAALRRCLTCLRFQQLIQARMDICRRCRFKVFFPLHFYYFLATHQTIRRMMFRVFTVSVRCITFCVDDLKKKTVLTSDLG